MISLLVRIGCRSDLKPENILLMEDGTVRLCDFGACYQVGIPGMYVCETNYYSCSTYP